MVLALLFTASMSWLGAPAPHLPMVVIDPGHGGHLDGAIGLCGAKEKDITLAIGNELAALLRASGRVRVAETRTDDRHAELTDRAQLANRLQAALFVSIHANASTGTEARGIETYFLSPHASSLRMKQLSLRENEGRAVKATKSQTALDTMLQSLTLTATHNESQRLALNLQGSLTGVNTRGRGVLQAPFIVLATANMAAVLVEVGFLTHADECELLATVDHQRETARAIARGILAHLAHERGIVARR